MKQKKTAYLAEGNDDEVLGVDSGKHLAPFRQLQAVAPVRCICLGIEILLDLLKDLRDLGGQLGNRDRALFSGVATSIADNRCGRILGAEFESEGNTLELPVGKLETWSTVVAAWSGRCQKRGKKEMQISRHVLSLTGVNIGTNIGPLESRLQFIKFLRVLLTLLWGCFGCDADRNQDRLNLGNSRGQNEALVIRVDHGHDTNDARGETP